MKQPQRFAGPSTEEALFAAAFAAALAIASSGGACSTSPLQPGSTGTAGTGGDSGGTGGGATTGSGGTGVSGSGGAAGSSCAVTHRTTPVSCPQSVASSHASLHERRRLHGRCRVCSHRALHPVRRTDAVFVRHVPVRRRLRRQTGDCLCQGQWQRLLHGVARQRLPLGQLSGRQRLSRERLCSPSVGFGAAFYGYVGYYCQTPQDQCRCDSDCASPLPSCAYNPEIGAWACASFGGAG